MRRLFLITAVMLSILPFGASAQNADKDMAAIKEALNYIRDGNIPRGFTTLQVLAEGGNPEAMFHVAELHRLGVGREKSMQIATMYYRFAAGLKHERASLSLANILYFDGTGSDKELSEALDIWQTLALQGSVEAAYMLGMLYWNGEAGLQSDPVRGYALVWLAQQGGYEEAEQNMLSMRALLDGPAREAAHAYAKDLEQQGFTTQPLALELVVKEEKPQQEKVAPAQEESASVTKVAAAAQAKPEPKKEEPAVKPEDWTTVWRLEVGFAMSEQEVYRLQGVISSTMQSSVGDLFSEISPSANRPGLFRLVYGPARSMPDAVSRCVALKRAGHDCFARPPETDDEDDYDDY